MAVSSVAGITVNATGLDSNTALPALSIARARTLCGPSARVDDSPKRNLPSLSAIVSPSSVSPSNTRTVTPGSAVPSREGSSSAPTVAPPSGRVTTGAVLTTALGDTRSAMKIRSASRTTATTSLMASDSPSLIVRLPMCSSPCSPALCNDGGLPNLCLQYAPRPRPAPTTGSRPTHGGADVTRWLNARLCAPHNALRGCNPGPSAFWQRTTEATPEFRPLAGRGLACTAFALLPATAYARSPAWAIHPARSTFCHA